MISFPNAKINLGLFITEKRDDGYHNLETVFYPVKKIKDALEIVPSQSETNVHIHGLSVAGNKEENLVWKAFQLLKEKFPGKIPSLNIHLLKAIPTGAGLGGGSADGAFMLRLLNDYCNLKLTAGELATLSLKLGSDCPFFIYNSPQFAMGRGERMQPHIIDLSSFEIKLITPGIHVSTQKAFRMITPRPAQYDLRKLNTADIENWKEYVINDFEKPVFHLHPELQELKQKLYDEGALYASMSGSGSAVYGIYRK